MSTADLIVAGVGALLVLAIAGLILRRSWGGSLDDTGRLPLHTPPAPGAPLPEAERAAIGDMIARGNKIAAIKRVRELTGLGLKEAKDAVEAWGAGAAPDPAMLPQPPAARGDLAEVQAQIDRGNTIAAIKLYRELTGVGLKEAKDAVEAIAAARQRR